MKEKRNLHVKVQEHCDCFATTDPLKEMSKISNDSETDEAALKWLALAALHGVNSNAKRISVTKSGGDIRVTAEYRTAELPSPGRNVADEIFNAIRDITHIDSAKGKLPLALGIRDSSVELNVKVKKDGDREKITLNFS